MLRVSTLSGGRAGYYLADRGDEVESLLGPDHGARQRWWGRGATDLGLAGTVRADPLQAVLEARHPVTGRRLRRRDGSVGGYDLTFAAPKSVSVLGAIGGPGRAAAVVGAHDAAVGAALGYLEDHAVAVRRRQGAERVPLAVDGLTAAAFPHGSSRTADPHLHTHVVVANVAHGADGRWSSLDSRGLFAHAAAGGALYRAHLRHELATRLGVDWRRAAGGWEVDGLDPVVLGEFSGRRADIRRHTAERSVRSARGRRVAATATRRGKVPAASRALLPERWAARAADLGLDGDSLATVTGRPRQPATGLDEHRFVAVLRGDGESVITRRRVLEAWSESLRNGAPGAEVEGSVDHWVRGASAVGVGEPPLRPSEVEVPAHLVRALGPRPATADGQPVWRQAAGAIEEYRRRWSVVDRVEPLGVTDAAAPLAALPVRRLADHLSARRQIAEARRRLGRDLERVAPGPDRVVER